MLLWRWQGDDIWWGGDDSERVMVSGERVMARWWRQDGDGDMVMVRRWWWDCEYFSSVNIFQGWIFSRNEYFSGVNISQRWIFFRSEYFSGVNFFLGSIFSGVNIFQGWIFLRGEYIRGEYLLCVNIFQGWTFLNSNLEFAQITLVLFSPSNV